MSDTRIEKLESDVQKLTRSVRRMRVLAMAGWLVVATGIGFVGWRVLRPSAPASELKLVMGDQTVTLSPFELKFEHGKQVIGHLDPGLATFQLQGIGGSVFISAYTGFYSEHEKKQIVLSADSLRLDGREGTLELRHNVTGPLTTFEASEKSEK